MSLVPITALVGWRIDGLARHLRFPLILTPKFGLDMGYYQTGTSGAMQQEGWSVGLSYGAQLALELDFLDVRAARRWMRRGASTTRRSSSNSLPRQWARSAIAKSHWVPASHGRRASASPSEALVDFRNLPGRG